METKTQYKINDRFVSVLYDGELYTVLSTEPNYHSVKEAIESKQFSKLENLLDIRRAITEFTFGNFVIKDGKIFYKKMLVQDEICDRIMESMSQGFEPSAYLKFFERVLMNPLFDSVEGLFRFLCAADIAITTEGTIVGYKYVKNNYQSYAKSNFDDSCIDWSIGEIPWLLREHCEFDPSKACKPGLHVGNRDFVGSYGDRQILVEVDPQDVISVPTCINYGKLRCCRAFSVYDTTHEKIFKYGQIVNLDNILSEKMREKRRRFLDGENRELTYGQKKFATNKKEKEKSLSYSTQKAGLISIQKAGDYSTQKAGCYSTQADPALLTKIEMYISRAQDDGREVVITNIQKSVGYTCEQIKAQLLLAGYKFEAESTKKGVSRWIVKV